MKQWKAESLLVFITLIWGGTFTFTKLGLSDCPPSLYIVFRFLIALTISLLIFGKHLKTLNLKTALHGMILGLLFGGGFILQTYGLDYTTPSISAFITGFTVSFTPFVFWIVERKPVKMWEKVGVVVAIIGLWIFSNPEFGKINIGDLLTLTSTLFWALYITYMDVFTRGNDSFSHTTQLVIFQFVAAAPLSLISFFIFDFHNLNVNFSENLFISLAYNGILASFLLTFIHTSVQRYSSPVKAALIFTLEPVFASVISFIALNEILSGREYFGASILLLGVVLAQVGRYIQKLVTKGALHYD